MTEHRSPPFEKPRLFDVRDYGPTVLKVWFPLLLWLSVVGLYQPPEKPGGLLLLGLFATLGLFLLTLALIVPNDCDLRYRRFFRWHAISYEKIVECKRSIFPGVGYIKFKQFIPPWGRLYFVFYAPTSSPFDRSAKLAAHKAVLHYIQDKVAGEVNADAEAETKIQVTPATPEMKSSVGVCALWALLGFVWALFLRMVLGFQPTIPAPSIFAHENILHRLGLALWRFGAHLLDWPYNLVVVIAVAAAIVAMRYRRTAWGPAAALGLFLGELLARFLQR